MSSASEPIVFGDADVNPPYRFDAYRSTIKRSPSRPLLRIPTTVSERTGPGPILSTRGVDDSDLTRNAGTGGEAQGQRIIVTGRVMLDDGTPLPNTLVEVWQANAAGRYRHEADQHDAPLDPHFLGTGNCLTDVAGVYRFVTVRPGAYPWGNHENGWRPEHIHFSVFGPGTYTRLVTQMYFPGDPLLPLDPILRSVPEVARRRLIAEYDHDVTESGYALGFRWDIILNGPRATPREAAGGAVS